MKRMKKLQMFSCVVAVMLLGLTTQALADERDDRLKAGIDFHVTALADADDGGAPHVFVLSGGGKFNDRHITGGGHFQDVDPSSGVPATIFSNGSWRATRLISFTETNHPNNPYGYVLSGIADMEVLLFPDDGPAAGVPATLKIVSNVGFGGVHTGLPEGFFLDVEDGLSYEPAIFQFGLTDFAVPGGPDAEFSALGDQLATTHELVRRLSIVHGVLRRGE